ncbi:TPA: PTS sugar transporter subunit IIC, partial [Enterococcus faecium]|nr:PTS sugar transporter subunit IIC [Enterococcus faecium]
DWRVVILIMINTLIAFIIYYPFVKAYDKKMLSDEQSRGENEVQTV